MRIREERVGVLRVDAHHEATLTAGRDGHVSADQKSQPTEHPLRGDIRFAGDQLPDAARELLVIRHSRMIALAGVAGQT